MEDIYNRLDTGAASEPSGFREPNSGPTAGTGHTLDEIMGKAPAVDDTNGATASDILAGKSYWSLESSSWGTSSGTMADNGAVTIVPTTTQQTIAEGYHNGAGTVAGDADLLASNIVQGAEIFGVTGSALRATGDAVAGDVLMGKRFSNASATGIAGTMADNGAKTIVPTTTQQTIAEGYHAGAGMVTDDTDLLASNIRNGVTLFGVTGTFNPRFTDNADGTVTDNRTGLIWLKMLIAMDSLIGGRHYFSPRTWEMASMVIADLQMALPQVIGVCPTCAN